MYFKCMLSCIYFWIRNFLDSNKLKADWNDVTFNVTNNTLSKHFLCVSFNILFCHHLFLTLIVFTCSNSGCCKHLQICDGPHYGTIYITEGTCANLTFFKISFLFLNVYSTCIVSDKISQWLECSTSGDVVASSIKVTDLIMFNVIPFILVKVTNR